MSGSRPTPDDYSSFDASPGPHSYGEECSLLGSDNSCHTAYNSTENRGYAQSARKTFSSLRDNVVIGFTTTFDRRKAFFWFWTVACLLTAWVANDGARFMSQDIFNSDNRDRIRRTWDREVQRHQEQVSQMQGILAKWAEEVESHHSARLAMEAERAEWDAERKAWEKIRLAERQFELERKKREADKQREEEEKKKAAIKWSNLKPDPNCLRYETRRYTATLERVPAGFDPLLLCRQTKAFIHGRWVLPDDCENKGAWSGTTGTWYVNFEEAGCHTFWKEISDKGCSTQGSGKRKIEAKLDNYRWEDDWKSMCSSTPAEFHGLKFPGPHACNPQWSVGVWFIEDGNCY